MILFHHVTVLQTEAVDGLAVRADGVYVDCTLGGAGHSSQIASRLSPEGMLIAFDQDELALANARQRLAPYESKVRLVKSNFRDLAEHVRDLCGNRAIDGILYDLGVSSPQLDEADRGFSYNHDAPLDMRMDRSQSLTAMDIVNEWSEAELSKILYTYGEEKFAQRIARRIIQTRNLTKIVKTGQLVELIKESIPAATRRTGPHPAKRSFQALRIAVNDELKAFEQSLEQALPLLAPGGRIAVITFHSLEDRICKQTFTKWAQGCICPSDFPQCACGQQPDVKVITKKPIEPSEAELVANPRARSAKLRIAEKRGK
jgi:16S rRNA (cytosine1402-N4)-methyltransferase